MKDCLRRIAVTAVIAATAAGFSGCDPERTRQASLGPPPEWATPTPSITPADSPTSVATIDSVGSIRFGTFVLYCSPATLCRGVAAGEVITPGKAYRLEAGDRYITVSADGYPQQGHVVRIVPDEETILPVELRLPATAPMTPGDVPATPEEPTSTATPPATPSPTEMASTNTPTAAVPTLSPSAIATTAPPRRTEAPLPQGTVTPDANRFVRIPPGPARLGSADRPSNPLRSVRMTGFWIARREVTVAEYERCVAAKRCRAPGRGPGCNWEKADRGDHPINCVSAPDAMQYATWLSAIEHVPYRLPTADELERAARGADGARYPWGNDAPAGRCNGCDARCGMLFKDPAVDDGWPETAPVGTLRKCSGPDAVYDLLGNVSEWYCDDHGAPSGVWGGSWNGENVWMDPTRRSERAPTTQESSTGFRLAAP